MQEFAYQQKLMGTDAAVSIITESEAQAEIIATEIFQQITDYEQRFSRFLPTSELSRLNQEKALVVSDTFLVVLNKSLELNTKTNGAYNPLVQIERQGYIKNYADLNKEQASMESDKYNLDLKAILIDETKKLINLLPDQKLDFGGMLKGYLVTKLTNYIWAKYEATISGLIINIGGDLHTLGTDAQGEIFEFYLFNPVTSFETPVKVKDASLATSGTYKRTWSAAGNKRHHILAKDGINNPTTDIISASIIHPEGALAEAYATTAIVSGIKELEKISSQENFNYFVIKTDGTTLTNIL